MFFQAVALLTIAALSCCSAQIQVDHYSCCKATPDRDRPTALECDCPNLEKISLEEGGVSNTLKTISISNTEHVVIQPNALFDLNALVNLTIKNASTAWIKPNALKMQNKSSFMTLKIENIINLTINKTGMSGFWNHSILIQINRISEAHIDGSALSFSSNSLGPSLNLENIQALHLSNGAFAGPISQLTVTRVKMNICQGGSFGRNIHHLNLDHVEIDEVMTESVSVSEQLSLRSCLLKKVHPQSFYGNMHQMTIENSTIGTVDTNAFIASITTLRVANTLFEDIRSNSFFISANSSVIFDDVRVKILRRHALVGIKITKRTAPDGLPIIIRNLSVLEAENGSLAFGSCVNIRLSGLRVTRPWPNICPTEKWIRLLLGIGPNVPLSQPQNDVYHEIRRDRPCPGDGWRPFPKRDFSSALNCNDDDAFLRRLAHTNRNTVHSKSAPARPSKDAVSFSKEYHEDSKKEDDAMDNNKPPKSDDYTHNQAAYVAIWVIVPLAAIAATILFGLVIYQRRHKQFCNVSSRRYEYQQSFFRKPTIISQS